ncbi:MAG: hypothetical protein JNK11_20105 [Alphaproteobacteria bacterium]|nr:hypothetical protein [Alphaproteobacteria bacterium]
MDISSVSGVSSGVKAALNGKVTADDLIARLVDHKKTLATSLRRGYLSSEDVETETKAISKILRRINRLASLNGEAGVLTTSQHASITRELNRQETRIREMLGLGEEV